MSNYNLLLAQLRRMKHNRLQNYIIPGLISELIGGPEHGKVRLFTATRDAYDWVTPHSHRFGFTSLVLFGRVHNTIFLPSDSTARPRTDQWCKSVIDQVCGVDGLRKYTHTRDNKPTIWTQEETSYETGETYYMEPEEIHSIQFDKGSVVLFFEGPQVTNTSVMLEPWVDGKCVPTFRTEPWMFEKDAP